MISNDILQQLVPQTDPEDGFPIDNKLKKMSPDDPARRIGLWASYLRFKISRDIQESSFLSSLIDTSGYVATGIFRTPYEDTKEEYSGFKAFRGFQFGAMLMRASFNTETDRSFIESVPLDFGSYRAPVMQTLSEFREHAQSPDGYVAATFIDDIGDTLGITARHVVKNFRRGQRVSIECSDCYDKAKLRRFAPGLLDAAIVNFPCGGPFAYNASNTRSAVEGETVEAHYGDSGKEKCTVMSALQTPAQIKSAAMPEHFLIDIHGHPGDSGSLISSNEVSQKDRDLIGVYLGQTDCEDKNRNLVTYGYALDLRQVAELNGIEPSDLRGEFND